MYQAPIDDYEFLLRHVVDGEKILQSVTHGEYRLDDAAQIWSGAADLAIESWHPLNAVGETSTPRTTSAASAGTPRPSP